MKKNFIPIIALCVCAFFLFLALYSLTVMGTYFHTDIARDFLLFDDILNKNHITLIGPRSGGISGVFHGPLWLYINMPVFILTNGNPYFIGIFWILLTCVGIAATAYCVFFLTRNSWNAWLSIAIATPLFLYSSLQLFNPFGAVLLSPLFFTILISYLNKPSFLKISIVLFLIGLAVQFQMAFAIPILVLTFPILAIKIISQKRWVDIAACGFLLIPLSTFIAFDIRHEFLQIRAVLSYLTVPKVNQGVFFWQGYLLNRLGSFTSGFGLLPYPWIGGVYILCFIWAWLKRKQLSEYGRLAVTTGLYLYIGYFVLTLLYKDTLWGYYTWPFAPIGVLLLFASSPIFPKQIWYILIITPVLLFGIVGIQNIHNAKSLSTQPGFWSFYKSTAMKVFSTAPNEFGYYIYTPDQYGYSERYAMKYIQNKNVKKAVENQKKEITYLLIAPAPKDKPYLSGEWWKKERVKITKKPVYVWTLQDGYRIEKYKLTKEEQLVPSDPLLIHSLIFR